MEFQKDCGDGYVYSVPLCLSSADVFYVGSSLLSKIKSAIEGEARTVRDFEEITASLPPEKVAIWEKQVLDWHTDPESHEDPYHTLWQGTLEIVLFIFKCICSDILL